MVFVKNRLVLFVIAILLLPVVHAFTSELRELTWDDLKSSGPAFDDPFENLSQDQLYNLGIVAKYRQRVSSGQTLSDAFKSEYKQAVAELKNEDVEYDDLLSRRAEITEKRRIRAQATNDELNGTTIRMPGYLLPLEFKEKGITEFLLVPWVGACIHTPPPPPNQIVHVVLDKDNAFESRSIYEPVWVAGQMLTQGSTKNLFLKDGSGNIDISYKLEATFVERYRQ